MISVHHVKDMTRIPTLLVIKIGIPGNQTQLVIEPDMIGTSISMAENPTHIVKEIDMTGTPAHYVKETNITGTTTHYVKNMTNTKGNPNYLMEDTTNQPQGALALDVKNTAMIPGGCMDPIFRDIQIHHPSEIVIMGKCPGSQVTVVRQRGTVTISMIRIRIVGALTKKRGDRTSTDIHLCRGNQQSSTVAGGISQFIFQSALI